MSLLEYPIILAASKKQHIPVSDFINMISMQFGTDDLTEIANRLAKIMYDNVDSLMCYSGITVFKGNLRYHSIYETGTPYHMRKDAPAKAEAQKQLWDYIRNQIDEMIDNNCDRRAIVNRFRWLRMVSVYYLDDMQLLCSQLNIGPVDKDPLRNSKFFARTATWLYYCVINYIKDTVKTTGRPAHVTKSKLHNAVIDGVVWNPYQFRRFLPFQFLNKLAAHHREYVIGAYLYNELSTVDYMNSVITVSVDSRISAETGKLCVRENFSKSFITSTELRDLGYTEDADLIESFGEYEVVKTAIMFFERAVLVRDAGRGDDVTGRFQEINDRVKCMDRWEIDKYLSDVYALHWSEDTEWYKDGDWKRLKSALF